MADGILGVVDLSRAIRPGMPVYPGTEPPDVAPIAWLDKDGFVERRLVLTTHAGTHLDAPAHLLAGGATVDRLPADRFVGPGLVIDVSGTGRAVVELDDLEAHRDRLSESDFVILRTGWAGRWGTPGYFDGYPVLSAGAARWLAGLPLKGVGVDAPSVDPPDSTDLIVHRVLLERGIVILENLADPGCLLGRRFLFCCWPLLIEEGDGSPVRATAILERA
jgi:arylformamidase